MHLLEQILPCATTRSFGAFDQRSSPNSGRLSDLPSNLLSSLLCSLLSNLLSSLAPPVNLALRYNSLLWRLRPTIQSTENLQVIAS